MTRESLESGEMRQDIIAGLANDYYEQLKNDTPYINMKFEEIGAVCRDFATQDLDRYVEERERLVRIDELAKLIEGDGTLGNSLLHVPDHPDDVRVVDVSQEWLADELNYRPRRAIVKMIENRLKALRQQVKEKK